MKIVSLNYKNLNFCIKHNEIQNHKTYLMFLFKFFNSILNFNFNMNYKNLYVFKHNKIIIFLVFSIFFKHNKTYVLIYFKKIISVNFRLVMEIIKKQYF